MKAIVLQIVVLVAVVAFVVFLAMDDRKNRKLRAEEDRRKALKDQQQAADQNTDKD